MFGENDHKRIGFNILRERREKDMTQEALADAVGMSRPSSIRSI